MDQTETEALEAAKDQRRRLLARIEPDQSAKEPSPTYNDALDPISPNFDPRSWA